MDPDDLALFILIEERLATQAVLDRIASQQLGEAWATLEMDHAQTYPTAA